MGDAKRRGTFEQRKAQAIAQGKLTGEAKHKIATDLRISRRELELLLMLSMSASAGLTLISKRS